MQDVVTATVAEQRRFASVNPAFDEKRKKAAVQFGPSRAPQERPWVEDMRERYANLGRRDASEEAARMELFTNLQ